MAEEWPESTWMLWHCGGLIGTLSECSPDQPWFFCRFQPTPEFERLRPFFERELRLLENQEIDELLRAWEEEPARSLRLRRADGFEPEEFIVHVNGDEAWFRW